MKIECLEGWPSGRRRLIRNQMSVHAFRGFESRSLFFRMTIWALLDPVRSEVQVLLWRDGRVVEGARLERV